jgi:hypothetical protein
MENLEFAIQTLQSEHAEAARELNEAQEENKWIPVLQHRISTLNKKSERFAEKGVEVDEMNSVLIAEHQEQCRQQLSDFASRAESEIQELRAQLQDREEELVGRREEMESCKSIYRWDEAQSQLQELMTQLRSRDEELASCTQPSDEMRQELAEAKANSRRNAEAHETKIKMLNEISMSQKRKIVSLEAAADGLRWGHANTGTPDLVITSFAREDRTGKSWTVQMDQHAWIDCEVLTKIFETGQERCSGDNGWVMLCSAVHAKFWELLKKVHIEGHDLLGQPSEGPKRLGMRCHHSKHRSRVTLHIARACFEAEGWVVHIQHARPDRGCGCPNRCRFAFKDRDDLMRDGMAAIQIGLRYWADISRRARQG